MITKCKSSEGSFVFTSALLILLVLLSGYIMIVLTDRMILDSMDDYIMIDTQQYHCQEMQRLYNRLQFQENEQIGKLLYEMYLTKPEPLTKLRSK